MVRGQRWKRLSVRVSRVGLFSRRREERLAELDAVRTTRSCRRKTSPRSVGTGHLTGDAAVEPLDIYARLELEQAVACLETSRSAWTAATDSEACAEVNATLTDGRFHLACAVARRDGLEYSDLSQLRTLCFFKPQHGPVLREVRQSKVRDARKGINRAAGPFAADSPGGTDGVGALDSTLEL